VTCHRPIYWSGGRGTGLTDEPIYSSVNQRIYTPYICRLTDEYKSFIFFYYCLFWLSPRTESLKNRQTIQHFTHSSISYTYQQIHNIVYNKQNKFDNYIVYDKRNENQNYGKQKQKNDHGTASLPSDPPIGFKRASTKSYP
jgi:hypothetical protein